MLYCSRTIPILTCLLINTIRGAILFFIIIDYYMKIYYNLAVKILEC